MEVWRYIEDNQRIYVFIPENSNIVDPVAYVGIEHVVNNVYHARNAQTSQPGKGLVKSLFLYLTKYEHIRLLSDSEMTKDGENLWVNLIKQGNFTTGIYSKKTGNIYSFDDVDKQINNEIVRDPRNVIGEEPNFYWFIEGRKVNKRANEQILQETITFTGV